MWAHVRDFLFLSFAVANGVFWGLLSWYFFVYFVTEVVLVKG